MPIAKIIKQPSDLITTTTVAPLNTGLDTAAVALLRRGTDATESVLLVHDPEEMPDAGFDETTDEYALVEAMFDVKNFKGPVMIGTYPNTDVISLNDVSVTPTADGATVSATISGVQKWLEDHLNDGPRWFIPVGMTTSKQLLILCTPMHTVSWYCRSTTSLICKSGMITRLQRKPIRTSLDTCGQLSKRVLKISRPHKQWLTLQL